MLIRLLLLLTFSALTLQAQDRSTNRWYFGSQQGLNFNTTPPTLLNDGQSVHIEGTSVVSDAVTGDLLFYSDGNTIWNRNHTVMATGINPTSNSSTQAVLIVRQPNSNTLYHLFSTSATANTAGVRHVIVDISLNGGLGGMVSNTQLIAVPVSEKVTASRTCDGAEYWVIFRRFDVAEFQAFRLGAGGLNAVPVISNSGTAFTNTNDARGEMNISPNGRLLASANETNIVDLFDFNNATGQITNRRVLSAGAQRYGLNFSPNSRWLYVNDGWIVGSSTIYRYDVTAANVAASQQVITSTASNNLGCMELGPDGKLYIAHQGKLYLSAITNPDALNPVYTDQALTLSKISTWGLPNFPQDIFIPDFAGPDTLVCPNQPVQIGISPVTGYSYSWTPANLLNNPTLAQPLATVTQTTVFTVVATDVNGCQITRDVTVNARPRPAITVTSDAVSNTICPDETVQLTANLIGGISFTWQPGALNSASINVQPAMTTIYHVTMTDANGCIWQDSIQIIVRARPNINITGSLPVQNDSVRVCSGDNVTLSATPGLASYLWNNGTALPNLTTNQAGRYNIEVTDANGCKNWDTIYVAVLPLPIADAGRDTSVCIGNTLQLQASGGTGYLWQELNGAPALSQKDISNPTLTSAISGIFDYAVLVTDANSCMDRDTIRVKVNALPLPILTPAVSDTAICSCETLIIGVTPAQNYEWRKTSSNQIIGTNQTLAVQDSGSYFVTVTDANGCSAVSRNLTVRIIDPTATMSVDIADSAYAGENVPISIVATSVNTGRCNADSFVVHLSMNRHALAPAPGASSGTINGDIRNVNIPGVMPPGGTFTTEMNYIATLGKMDTTAIRIDSVVWNTCPVVTTVSNAAFHLAGVCKARGTKRLYDDNLTMMALSPNPAGNNANITINTSADIGIASILVTDVLGRVVTRVFKGDILPGKREFEIQTSGLPDGIYILALRSPSVVNTMIMEVRK